MPNDNNYHQNDFKLGPKRRLFTFRIFRNFAKAGLTLSNVATYSAMGFFILLYASRRALNYLSIEYCQVDAKR